MLKKGPIFSLFVLAVLTFQHSNAQTFDNIKDKKPFSITGGVGAGTSFYSSNEERLSRDPFSWNIHGHLNPSVYGYSFPVSFSISQYTKSFREPFSQMGISPSYKWAKLHLGYRSIAFSPLVFDGNTFLGAGLELNPGKFYFAGFWGRVNKAIGENTTANRHIQPQYARKAFGVKIGLKSEKAKIDFQYFNARDDTTSIERIDSENLAIVLPQSNDVIGTSWEFVIFKKLTFKGNSALSLLNQNLAYKESDDLVGFPSFLSKIFPVTNSSLMSWAADAQLSLALKNFNAMLGYRRVQPDFKSLGIPYFLNDIQMFSGNVGTNLAKGRINLNAAFTSQHNNLGKKLNSELVTMTGNFSASALVSQNFFISANFTGVNVHQKDGLISLTDSTRMNQLMLSLVVSPTLNFYSNTLQHNIGTSFTYTNLNDKNPSTTKYASGSNINASTNYSIYFSQKYFGINTGFLYSSYKQEESDYMSLGANLGLNTQLLKSKNLSLQGEAGYFFNRDSHSPAANNITFSFNSSYSLKNQHSFGLYVSYIITPPVNLNPLDDIYNVPYSVNSKMLSGGVNYSYNF